MESSASLCVFGSDAQLKQLAASLNQHADVVAAAHGLVDLLRGVHLCSVYLNHDVSLNHSSSKINAVVLNLGSATQLKSLIIHAASLSADLLAGEPMITL